MTEQTTTMETYTVATSQEEHCCAGCHLCYNPRPCEMDDGEIQYELDFAYDERKKLANKVQKNGGIWTAEYERIYQLMAAYINELEAELSRRENILCAHCGVERATLFEEYCADCYWDSEEDYKQQQREQKNK